MKRALKKTIVKQRDITDCGAACLASVATWYGLKMPVARIRQYASTDQKGTNVLGLMEAASRLGFSAKAVKADMENLQQLPLPVIAHVVVHERISHYVVVYAVSPKGVTVMDPFEGRLEVWETDAFQKKWTGVLVLLAPGAAFEKGDNKVSVFSRFLYLMQPHRAVMMQVLLGAVVYTLLGLSTAIFLQKIVDNVMPDGNRKLLNLMGMVMVVILLLQFFINHVKTILTVKTGQQIDARLILGYYKHLLRLPQQFFDTMRVGEIISRMNDAVKIRVFINDVLISIAVNIFILFFSFGLMFTSYWKLAMLMLGIVPLYALVYYYANKANKHTQRKLMENSAELEAQLVESVNAAGTIKRFGLEEYANMKTEDRFIKMLRTVFKSATNGLWTGNVSQFINSLFTVLLLWVGTSFVLSNSITPGELLSFYAIIGYFTSPVVSLIGMNKTMQDAFIAADRLFEIMDLEKESEGQTITLTREMVGDIVFKDVHFRYGSRVNVFDGLQLTIPKGKVTAVIGESGSGKTTLLSLLQHMYPLQSGHIYIGDTDIRYISPGSLRSIVSVVPQKIDLFAGNVIENIAVGEYEPDLPRLLTVCKAVGILEMIERLPNGLGTYLGENGASLSGGQRQRLAIARALYRNPEILILDEATSALDSQSELHIQQCIRQLGTAGKTVILIAHRLSSVVQADNILVMHEGKIIEQGSHGTLLHPGTVYYTMWEQQFPMIAQIRQQRLSKIDLSSPQ
ncbi:bacteriocin-processing peptidase. Cysteine peptidase. MEROPS family C39 [Filimonas lacunae]|uniref:Bacteriocin-processing peptidase. Cysteine peptidase. MEROPS family C39 n=1 Tax=Filimonas lacunae TaxID=477680 RepID=A0A173MP36_9BACT|nr:peptidase domain-containing ABC transporter [Filimonas lacunae]BAV09435.1 lipid A export ATP-binding/permease protein MsbA [Filimonas lacunae]SIS73099.1 bacteriocin-processing peptidase. Cysteine peptidase. MEROPS family C39 [Filimonas lacunae]